MGEIEESFKLFMDWVVYLNGLHKLGGQILVEFAKKLGAYRRAKSEEAEYIARVAAAAHSQRLSVYLGPGSWLEDTSKALAAKSHDCLNHLIGISKDAIKDHSEHEATTEVERFNLSIDDEGCVGADRTTRNANFQGRLPFSEYSSMMALIYKMLEEDYNMQRKIVEALGLDTPAEALTEYCTMWLEQPCIKSYVIDRALSWTQIPDESIY